MQIDKIDSHKNSGPFVNALHRFDPFNFIRLEFILKILKFSLNFEVFLIERVCFSLYRIQAAFDSSTNCFKTNILSQYSHEVRLFWPELYI